MPGHNRANSKTTPTPGGAVAPLPLVETKIAIPGVRRAAVDRPRLRRAFDEDERACAVVAAPAGYGKTTAVRGWCATLDAGLAWVTLDAADNDPIRLWRYVATAVDRVRPGLGRTALQRLEVPGDGVDSVVDELMNGIGAYGRQLVLVLDDLHTVTDPECLSSLDIALLHLPANARLVVVSSWTPFTCTSPERACDLGVAGIRGHWRGSPGTFRGRRAGWTRCLNRKLLPRTNRSGE